MGFPGLCNSGDCVRSFPYRARSDVAHVHLGDDRHANQVRQAARLQLLHHPRAVHLDRARADAELAGDGLVGRAAGEPFEDIPLARGQPVEPAADVAESRFAAPRFFVQGQSLCDCVENGIVRKRLLDEVDGACLDRPDRHRDVAVARDDDDRQRRRRLDQPPLQLEPVHVRHPHVDEGAGGHGLGQGAEEGRARGVGVDVVAGGLQQRTQRIAHRIVIVDDGDRGVPLTHRTGLRPAG